MQSLYNSGYSWHSPGWAGGPAGGGHSKLARVCTGLPLTSVQFISMAEVVTKKHNEFFCDEAEIGRVRHWYLMSFAGLHFENEPALTESDVAECRRNTPLCVSKRR